MPAATNRFAGSSAVVLALLLIALAILVTANELRFQGCNSRIDRQVALAAEREGRPSYVVECSRIPFAAG